MLIKRQPVTSTEPESATFSSGETVQTFDNDNTTNNKTEQQLKILFKGYDLVNIKLQ